MVQTTKGKWNTILHDKALKFYEELKQEGEPGFTARRNGWLDRWKQRNRIKKLSIYGEKLSADACSVSKFKIKFHNHIEEEGLNLQL